MKERPILFSGPMVKALLEGRKTQTRRIVNPQPTRSLPHTKDLPGGDGSWKIHHPQGWRWQKSKNFSCYTADQSESSFAENLAPHSPYGQPGDRLWVKETHALRLDCEPGSEKAKHYALYQATYESDFESEWHSYGGRWRPSIHMPRWASRITVEVTSVRVERLQDIACVDIRAEGVTCPEHDFPGGMCVSECPALRSAFEKLWDEINGRRSPWASNAWVWVMSFRRLP